jgi:hypothetical protein
MQVFLEKSLKRRASVMAQLAGRSVGCGVKERFSLDDAWH